LNSLVYNSFEGKATITIYSSKVPVNTQVTFSVSSNPNGWIFANWWDDYGASGQSNTQTFTINVGTGNHKLAAFFTQAPPPAFAFSISTPSSQSIAQGDSGTFSFTVTTTSDTPQSVSLSLLNQPPGTALSWGPSNTLMPATSGTSVQVTIQTSCSTPAQTYSNVQITGQGGGASAQSGYFGLTVSISPPCVTPQTVEVKVYSLDLQFKGKDPSSLPIANDLRGYVQNSYEGKATVTIYSFQVPVNTQIKFSVSSTPSGWAFANWWDDYGASGQSNTLTLTINVGTNNHRVAAFFIPATTPAFGFSISTPSSQSISQGDQVTFSFVVTTTTGTPQSVTLSLLNQPSNTRLSWSQNPITPSAGGTSVQLTVQTNCGTDAQTYGNLQVTGSGGAFAQSGYFGLTVKPSASCSITQTTHTQSTLSTTTTQSTATSPTTTRYSTTVTTATNTPQSPLDPILTALKELLNWLECLFLRKCG
jgi:hypothetical protein